MKSGVLRVCGLLFVLAGVAYFKFIYLPDEHGDAIARNATAIDPRVDNAADRSAEMTHGNPVDYNNVPQSSWLMNERRLAATDLGRNNVSLLIVPVQGDKNAFDPIERSLITRILSENLQQLGVNYVADPSKVLQYLGTNRPSFSPPDIRRLAAFVKADKILLLRAEHDRASRWSLSATLKSADDSTENEVRTWTDLSFGDSITPSASFVGIIPEISEFATGQRVEITRVNPVFDEGEFQFPDSFEDLIERSDESPLHAAGYLQMIGMLHPRGDFNETRNHLFERSLVELEKVSPDAPFYRYFKARAYAYLDRRPAAVAVLADATDRHEKALLAALNGNLPNLQIYVEGNDTSVLRFMALKDLQKIEYWYSVENDYDSLEKFTEAHPVWAPLLYRSLRDYDGWASYSAATLKFALETLLPSEFISLEGHYEKLAVVGDSPDELNLARLLWKHIESLEGKKTKKLNSDTSTTSVISAVDILELIKTISIANHLREVEEDLNSRRVPSAALDELSRYESFYIGHPAVTLLKGRVLQAMSKKSTGAERMNLILAAKEAEANGFAWTGRLTAHAVDVARGYSRVYGMRGGYSPGRDSVYTRYSRRFFEWPKSSGWNRSFPREEREDGALQRCIDYMWTAFECLRWKIGDDSEESDNPELVRSTLLEQYANRYLGHPKRDEYAVEHARASGGKDAELRALLSKIEDGSTDPSLYYALGRIYKRRGEYEKAQEAWLSYPGFRSGSEPIDLAEVAKADHGAAMLYWIGQYELAMPLLEIAASSTSRSESNLTSSVRVALISGDLESAATWSADRVRRYNSKYALRDFLQLLHILGESELAWSTFDQFQAVQQHSQMWSGALVGHRKESATTDEIDAWIHASDSRKSAEISGWARNGTPSLAARYLLLAGTMDRVPSAGFEAMVSAAYDRPRPTYHHRSSPMDRPGDSGESIDFAVVRDGQREYKHDDLVPVPQIQQRVDHKQIIDHRYTMLAGAMTAFLNEAYQDAYEQFNETAYYYFLDEYLPYYAFSAAKTGQGQHLQDLLAAREIQLEEILQSEELDSSNLGYRFDEDLTYAVLAALAGNHDSAMSSLRSALNNRPYLEDRPIYPMYQIVDIADRLFEQTGEEVYRDFALDLGRRHTVILPMYSWAYFVVAKYSQSDFERVSATASGLHLDPLSHRASNLEKELLDRARELLERNGPPYLKSNGVDDRTAT